MNLVPVINQVKCTGCGKCVDVCPKKVLYLDKKKAKAKGNDCMLCSHCFAVCGSDAVSFENELEDIEFKTFKYKEKILGSSNISPDVLVNAFRSRRSIRKFKNDEIDDDVLRDLVEFAVTAPSGSNCQEWEFTVINGREKVWEFAVRIKDFFLRINKLAANRLIRYLSVLFMGKALINYYNDHYETVELAIKESEIGVDLLFHGAPCVIIIHGPMEGSTPVEDATYAAYNICMLAHYMNLGTCLIGFAVEALNRSPDIKQELDIYEKNRIHAVIALGKPAVRFTRHSLRKKYSVEFI
jgi:nitroreductase/NAD-dependent dihydropyrimidine dehydrogenase PreA subunit